MLLDTDRDRNIDVIGKKMSIFCQTHIAVGHRIQGGRPGHLRLKYAVEYNVDKIKSEIFINRQNLLRQVDQ